jgi:hypothetical protein
MRTAPLLVVILLAGRASAGELDLTAGAQATTTGWPDDNGGGPNVSAGWWFRSYIGAEFLAKYHYAPIDDRIMSYYAVSATTGHRFGPLRLEGAFGFVHQHEESRAAIMEQPFQAVFGVGDGIRHRMGSRAGFSLGLPFVRHRHGDLVVALDVDGTVFADSDRGPRWIASAGLSIGFTYDFTRRSR